MRSTAVFWSKRATIGASGDGGDDSDVKETDPNLEPKPWPPQIITFGHLYIYCIVVILLTPLCIRIHKRFSTYTATLPQFLAAGLFFLPSFPPVTLMCAIATVHTFAHPAITSGDSFCELSEHVVTFNVLLGTPALFGWIWTYPYTSIVETSNCHYDHPPHRPAILYHAGTTFVQTC
ncbi:hypothetical protein FISHEDRAFT_71330 [Fistulina hepatica ATCC 64428]|nr:hypothetical protein FISHEDRAFT_71330 [Fistulina hepatica ATCC 64428]